MPESLSARGVAEYLAARDASRDGVLARYARPDEEQTAVKIMHNPVRMGIRAVLTDGINEAELVRLTGKIREHSEEDESDRIWIRACLRSIEDLRALQPEGVYSATRARRLDLTISDLRVKSSIDFLGTYTPDNRRMKPRSVAVIVNIPGIKVANTTRRDMQMQAESELAFRILDAQHIEVDEVHYTDLPRHAIALRYTRRSERLWKDVVRVCRTIVADFPRIRADLARRARDRRNYHAAHRRAR